jgi:hypothetical protein
VLGSGLLALLVLLLLLLLLRELLQLTWQWQAALLA